MPDSTSKIDSISLRPRTVSSGEVGRILGNRYRLVAQIGAGASAQVFLADDLSLGRRVAVKCLRSGLSDDARFVKRFRAEATAAAQLSHPNLLAVYDWDESPSSAYIVTEVLLGGSLLDLIDRQPLSRSQGLLVALQVAQGLKYAHSIGWVHRDIKPANLLFGQEGRLRIADFGIARAVAEAAWTEPEGVLVGTARYAAPEQAEGDAIDGKADIYSLALTIVEAVTGRLPLLGENALSTMVLRQDRDIDGFEELGALGTALAGAGRADPRARPTAAQLIENLTRTARSLPRPQRLPLSSGPARFTHPTGEPENLDGAIDLRDKPENGATVRRSEGLDGHPGSGVLGQTGPGHEADVEGHQIRPGDRIKSRPIPRPSDGRVGRNRSAPRPRFAGHRTTSANGPADGQADGRIEDRSEDSVADAAPADATPTDDIPTDAIPTDDSLVAEPAGRAHESEEHALPAEEVQVEEANELEGDSEGDVGVDAAPETADGPDGRLVDLPDSAPFKPWQWSAPQSSPEDERPATPSKPQASSVAPPASSWLDQSKLDPVDDETTPPVSQERAPTTELKVEQSEQDQRPPSVFEPPSVAPGSLTDTTFFATTSPDVSSGEQPVAPQAEPPPTGPSQIEPASRKPLPITTPPVAKSSSVPASSGPSTTELASDTGEAVDVDPENVTENVTDKGSDVTPAAPEQSASKQGIIPSIFDTPRRGGTVPRGQEQEQGQHQDQGQSESRSGTRGESRSQGPQRSGPTVSVPPETTASVRAEVNQLRSRRRGRRQEPPRPVRLTRLFEEDAGAVPPTAKRGPQDKATKAPTLSGLASTTHTSTPTPDGAGLGGASVVRLDASHIPDQASADTPAAPDPNTPATSANPDTPATSDTPDTSSTSATRSALGTSIPATTALAAADVGAPAIHAPTDTASRRRPQWLAMAVLICLILVMIGAVTAIAVRSESGTEAASPGVTSLSSSVVAGDYLGGPVSEAESDAERYNWLLSITEERRSGTEAGEVIEQEPVAGESLADGDRLNIVVSLGPDLRTVPSIVGLTLEEATVILERADLEVGEVTEVDVAESDISDLDTADLDTEELEGGDEEGLVVALEVEGDEPDARLEAGTAIDLIVSAAPSASPMPSFVGLSVSRAVDQADELGLELRQEEAFSERYDEGFVVHTEPPTDAMVEPGDTVTIVVSRGTPFVAIPNVVGMSPDEAAAELRAAGFEPGTTSGPADQPVVATDPAVGEAHRKGRVVAIFTGPSTTESTSPSTSPSSAPSTSPSTTESSSSSTGGTGPSGDGSGPRPDSN